MYQMRQAMLAPKSEEPTTHESQVDCNTKQCLQLFYGYNPASTLG